MRSITRGVMPLPAGPNGRPPMAFPTATSHDASRGGVCRGQIYSCQSLSSCTQFVSDAQMNWALECAHRCLPVTRHQRINTLYSAPSTTRRRTQVQGGQARDERIREYTDEHWSASLREESSSSAYRWGETRE